MSSSLASIQSHDFTSPPPPSAHISPVLYQIMANASPPDDDPELAPLSKPQIFYKLYETFGQAAYAPWANADVKAYQEYLHDVEHVKADTRNLRAIQKRYHELLHASNAPRAPDDNSDEPAVSSRASPGSGRDGSGDYTDLPADSLAQLRCAMEELQRRIAHPGYYRRLAIQRIYNQPPEALRARDAEGARVLAQYLWSSPKS